MGRHVRAAYVRSEAPFNLTKKSPNSFSYLGAWHQAIAGRGVHVGQGDVGEG